MIFLKTNQKRQKSPFLSTSGQFLTHFRTESTQKPSIFVISVLFPIDLWWELILWHRGQKKLDSNRTCVLKSTKIGWFCILGGFWVWKTRFQRNFLTFFKIKNFLKNRFFDLHRGSPLYVGGTLEIKIEKFLRNRVPHTQKPPSTKNRRILFINTEVFQH